MNDEVKSQAPAPLEEAGTTAKIEPERSASVATDPDRPSPNQIDPLRSAPNPGTEPPEEVADVLTIGEVQALYEEAGTYRNQTTLRKYCRLGRIEGCFKADSLETQDKWMAPRDNALRYLEQIQSLDKKKEGTTQAEPDRSESKQAEEEVEEAKEVEKRTSETFKLLEAMNLSKEDQITFLRTQIATGEARDIRKDEHIEALTKTIGEMNETAGILGAVASQAQSFLQIENKKKEDVHDVPKSDAEEITDVPFTEERVTPKDDEVVENREDEDMSESEDKV